MDAWNRSLGHFRNLIWLILLPWFWHVLVSLCFEPCMHPRLLNISSLQFSFLCPIHAFMKSRAGKQIHISVWGLSGWYWMWACTVNFTFSSEKNLNCLFFNATWTSFLDIPTVCRNTTVQPFLLDCAWPCSSAIPYRFQSVNGSLSIWFWSDVEAEEEEIRAQEVTRASRLLARWTATSVLLTVEVLMQFGDVLLLAPWPALNLKIWA